LCATLAAKIGKTTAANLSLASLVRNGTESAGLLRKVTLWLLSSAVPHAALHGYGYIGETDTQNRKEKGER
jgi:hypothetical protein